MATTPSAAQRASHDFSGDTLREIHLFMRLAREWDLRFERLLRTGAIGKWYSSVGNEGVTVPAAQAIEAGDALLTLHRDSGAILRHYLDPAQIFPDLFSAERASGTARRLVEVDSGELLFGLACQMLGREPGFTAGRDRSYHYNLIRREAGLIHVGMISHIGAMIPVAAGMALALKQEGEGRVALNFIGEGGTSTGDFHEALNMAAVLTVPLILVIENNGWAFSTPTNEQFACDSLAQRGGAYGMPGISVDGSDVEAVLGVMNAAVERARRGDGPTLVEARVSRLRGHSESDDSYKLVEKAQAGAVASTDPVELLERRLIEENIATREELTQLAERCHELVLSAVDRALEAPEPTPESLSQSPYAK